MSNFPVDVLAADADPTARPRRFSVRKVVPGGDVVLKAASQMSGLVVLLMLASLVAVLFVAALPSIRTFGVRFVVGRDWRPNPLDQPKVGPDGKPVLDSDGSVVTETIPPAFGALPVIYGTAVSSALALLFAIPLSLGAAIFLVRIAPLVPVAVGEWVGHADFLGAKGQRVGHLLASPLRYLTNASSFLIEFLAAIPSIAYGIWGLFVLAPFLQGHIEPGLQATVGRVPGLGWLFRQTSEFAGQVITGPIALTGRDMFGGSLVLSIMILPIITAISRDVLRQVPRAQVEGTVALGATWWESSKEMLEFSRSGLFGAVMLGLARAAGETMAVTMVIGNNNQIVPSPFAPAQTMSSLLANEFAEASTDLHRAALCEVALVLLVMSLVFNVVARRLVVGRGDSRTAAAF